ncbi:MAG: polymerase, partial [Thermoleophilia bacterium]|nr:polymerase [Thermoleophilia bacterium]
MTISESKLRAARTATILITIVASLAAAGPAAALPIFAVTAGEAPFVLHFDSATPGTVDGLAPVTGLANGETVVGLDQRPATDEMYVLTKVGAVAKLRVLYPITGVLDTPLTLAADPADLTSPYTNFGAATAYGIDFNPVPDRLRVTTDLDANVRVNPTTGLVTTDNDLSAGTDLGVAYTNNFSGAVTTTLYAYNWDDD